MTSNLYEVQNAATLVKLGEKKEGRKEDNFRPHMNLALLRQKHVPFLTRWSKGLECKNSTILSTPGFLPGLHFRMIYVT